MTEHEPLSAVAPESVYPDVERLLHRARQAADRLWNDQRDDGAGQVIDELVARLEESLDG